MSTIVAISTAPGIGGIGIVRMSGEKTFEIINKIFKPKNDGEIKGYTMKYGNIINYNNQIIDEVLVSYFISPKSYTTENMCEINSHGGIVVLREILELCVMNGAKIAEPGEFTKRAFLNGRIDLTQAEAVINVIEAKGKKELKSAMDQLKGDLKEDLRNIKNDIFNLLTNIEVNIDYPEYDVEEVTNENALIQLEEIRNKLNVLANSFEKGKIIKNGINIAIVGKPNAGKSSLLNALLREERAIVTEYEGTTRDTIEEYANINGIPVKYIDTAGIRETENEVEKIGIYKSKEIIDKSDLILGLFDISKDFTDEDYKIINLIKDKNTIIVLNKIDLNNDNKKIKEKYFKNFKNKIEISAKNKLGIDKIYDIISDMFNINEINIGDETILTNIRHKELIMESAKYCEKSMDSIKNGMPIDVVAINVREILEKIGEITGETVSEEIIKDIFSKFCLGK